MTLQTTPTTEQLDRIKLPFSFDVDQMKKELEALKLNDFVYYNVLPLRSPAHIVDPSLPFPPPAEDYADGSWTDWANTNELKQSPYFNSILEFFQKHTTVTLVRLLRLEAGEVVQEHTDPTLGLEITKSVIRLTIPIISDDGVDFILNGTTVDMKPGECWYLRLTDPHKVINHSTTERINLTIDMIPNDWIRTQIKESQQ